MGIICSIIGKQGSGKTRSIKTIKNLDELIVLRPSRKPFSFRNKLTEWNKETGTGQFFYADESAVICGALKKFYEKGKRIFVLEDSTFIMTNYFMETAMEKGLAYIGPHLLNCWNILKKLAVGYHAETTWRTLKICKIETISSEVPYR
jgi:hypothetical protein